MNYLIGIDLGTSSTKTVLFDEDGNVIASAGKDYPLYTPNNGWAEQKPEDWRDAALETIAKVVKESGVNADDIKGLQSSGVTSVQKRSVRRLQKKSVQKDLSRLLQTLHLQDLLLQKSSG